MRRVKLPCLCKGSQCRGFGDHRDIQGWGLGRLKGGYIGSIFGATIGVIKGDTKSLDSSSCKMLFLSLPSLFAARGWGAIPPRAAQ